MSEIVPYNQPTDLQLLNQYDDGVDSKKDLKKIIEKKKKQIKNNKPNRFYGIENEYEYKVPKLSYENVFLIIFLLGWVAIIFLLINKKLI
jgi:hypothetical protein